MLSRRYVCFICYSFHPEMKGVSEKEVKEGDNVCLEVKCKRSGQPLEAADYCDICHKLFRPQAKHHH